MISLTVKLRLTHGGLPCMLVSDAPDKSFEEYAPGSQELRQTLFSVVARTHLGKRLG